MKTAVTFQILVTELVRISPYLISAAAATFAAILIHINATSIERRKWRRHLKDNLPGIVQEQIRLRDDQIADLKQQVKELDAENQRFGIILRGVRGSLGLFADDGIRLLRAE